MLLTLWVLAYGWSVVGAWGAPPSGEGFTRGINRVGLFLGWQAVAGLLGVATLAIGRGWPKGSGIRRVSAVPFWLALALLAGLLGFYGWAMVWA